MKRKATILKSLRSQEGAEGYLKLAQITHPDAFIVKSFGDDLVCEGGAPSGFAHVVIAQDLDGVVEAISAKDAESMFKALHKAGFIEGSEYGVALTSKFYDVLNDFTKKHMDSLFKAMDAAGGVAQALEKQDLEGVKKTADEDDKKKDKMEELEVLKAVLKSVMSQKDADNHEGGKKAITDAEANKETKDESKVDGKKISQPDVPSDVPDAKEHSQAEADNYEGDNSNTSVTESHPDSAERVDDNQKNIRKSVNVFKSLTEGNQWIAKNPGYELDGTSFMEKKEHGARYGFIAREKKVKPTIGAYGNRKR